MRFSSSEVIMPFSLSLPGEQKCNGRTS